MDEQAREKIFDLFTQISICKSFSAEEIKEGFFKKGLARIIEYSPGETIIDEGKYDNWVYWLIEGQIDVVKKNVTIATFQRVGDMFGEMGILEGDARSASVNACTGTVCLAIDMSILDHPDVKNKISRENFCRDIAQVTRDRLAKTTSRLSEVELGLTYIRKQLETSEQKRRETMATLKKTLEKLEEKDRVIAGLETRLADAEKELARLRDEH